MTRDDDIRIRPGRIRSTRSQRARPFIAQALAATQKAGGRISRGRIIAPRGSRFGRGKVASVVALRRVSARSRNVVIKARIVRHGRTGASLGAHLKYLQRDGVTRDGEKGRLFGGAGEGLDRDAFATRCEEDRHHFRFIVSPEDAIEMGDLKDFARDLMVRMQKDLDTPLDWVAVDHWNTGQPHVHIIVRGLADNGQDLVIARDYINDGMRAQARDIVTQELGLRTDLDIQRTLERQVDAERWTDLDRALSHDRMNGGLIDMAPEPGVQPDGLHALKVRRLRKLERLGLADEIVPGQWTINGDAEPTLRAMGQRGDIIKRMYQALTERGIDRTSANYVLEPEPGRAVIGRLVDRGLHDELTGSAYAIVDGIDGRTHHILLPDLDASGDARPGAIVELRRFEDRKGVGRIALAVRSDMDIQSQITAPGATWLDRRNLGSDGNELGGGFGREVQAAMEARSDHLAGEGLARRQGQRVIFTRDLLDRLKQRELGVAADKLVAETGLNHTPSKAGEYVAGTVRQRLTLASGRYAMIDNGLGFALVPWSPSIDRQMGKHISGVMRGDGGVDWALGRGKGLGL